MLVRWDGAGGVPPPWHNRVPQAIVDAFEAEGFIWGGPLAALRHDALRVAAGAVGPGVLPEPLKRNLLE